MNETWGAVRCDERFSLLLSARSFAFSFEYISFVNWKLNYWFTCARLCRSMEALMCSLCVLRARDCALEHGAGQNIIHLMNINVDSTRFLYLSCLFLFFRRCIIKSIIEISFSAFESLFIEFIESRWRRRIHTWWMLGEDCSCEMPARVYRRYFYFCKRNAEHNTRALAKERFMNKVKFEIIISNSTSSFFEVKFQPQVFSVLDKNENEESDHFNKLYKSSSWVMNNRPNTSMLRPAIVAPPKLKRELSCELARDWYTKENKSGDVIVRNRVQ